jgi:acyl-CoA synthetase (AMP-forming)/AMP-acid ligase II
VGIATHIGFVAALFFIGGAERRHMQVLGDLVAQARDRDGVLFRSPERAAPYSYSDFATNAWKGGNLLRHYGVRHGTRVAVVVGPKEPTDEDRPGYLRDAPDALLAFLAAALDGAVVDMDPPNAVDATALVAPAAWLDRYTQGPGTKGLAYGGPVDDPTIAQFERELWSENPLQPPGEVAPDDAVLAADRTYTHGELMAESGRVVADYDIDAETTVALRAPMTTAGAVVVGLLAPMRTGATVVFGGNETADIAVADGDVPEETVVRPDDATPS